MDAKSSEVTARDLRPPANPYSAAAASFTGEDVASALAAALAPAFLLVRELGAGGMGKVYLARDPRLKRYVAVKVLAPDLAADNEARQRFQREAQAVAAINHPNVINIFGVGELADGTPYIVMEYVSGRSVADRLNSDGPMPVREAVGIMADVAAALAEAHKQGIIHRDIKPANILIDEESGRAEVTDFGIASVRRSDDDGAEKLTQAGTSVGTPAYMSPEQILAEPVSDKTDVYNMGLLIYELLSAQGPYDISSPRELIAAHLRDVPAKLSARCAEVDLELEALAAACLAKDPNQRPAAADVAQRLQKGEEGMLEWPPPGLEGVTGRLRWATEHLALGALLLVGPLLIGAAFERESFWREMAPSSILLGAVSFAGFVMFSGALVRLAMALWRAANASRAGYGWGTIFEVLSDDRGDGGALISGSREYAILSPAERQRLRLLRHVRADLRFLAGISPVFGLFAGLASAGNEPAEAGDIVFWSLVPMGVLYVASHAAGGYERMQLRKARMSRSRRRAIGGTSVALIKAWNESFENVRQGQRLGSGRIGGGRRVLAGVVSALSLIAVLGVGAYTLSLIGTAGDALWGQMMPSATLTTDRISRAKRLAPFRGAIDSSITPLAAGEAVNAIYWYGRHRPALESEREPVRRYRAGWVYPTDSSKAFGDSTLRDAMVAAARGLSPAQRVYLERAAAFPAAAEFELAGRARTADLAAAMYRLPLAAGVTLWSLPIPQFGRTIQAAAYAHQARAALDLADGNRAGAERRLREVIAVGLLLIEGNTLIENLVGASIVNRARPVLEAFYDVTGRPGDARAVAAAAVIPGDDDPTTRVQTRAGSSAEALRAVRTIVVDTTSPRGLRWEMLVNTIAIEPCTDLHQMVFGPSEAQRRLIRRVRNDLVRWQSDANVFRLIEAAYESGPALWDTERTTFGRFLGRALDRVVGGRRFETCAALIQTLLRQQNRD